MNLTYNLNNILFLDIETVPEEENWNLLSKNSQELFEQKTQYQRKDEFTAEQFYNRAGIWAEFGKIICISVGYFVEVEKKRQLRLRSFFGDDEHKLLTEFKVLLDTHFAKKSNLLCAHNGKEFDFPFLSRRMIIHQIELPKKLNLFGKKPWEVPHIDTLEMWKFGDYKNYTSLHLLATIFGIPSPKDDMEGSDVHWVYWKDQDLQRIQTYCQKDVLTTAQLLLRFKGLPSISDDAVSIVS